MVFCLSGIVTVPILEIFTKPSMLNSNRLSILEDGLSTKGNLFMLQCWCLRFEIEKQKMLEKEVLEFEVVG
jgi:hypothetical protein